MDTFQRLTVSVWVWVTGIYYLGFPIAVIVLPVLQFCHVNFSRSTLAHQPLFQILVLAPMVAVTCLSVQLFKLNPTAIVIAKISMCLGTVYFTLVWLLRIFVPMVMGLAHVPETYYRILIGGSFLLLNFCCYKLLNQLRGEAKKGL
jgi:hypothetical protein